MTSEIFNAAERTFHAANLKPKDVSAVIAKLETEFGVVASVVGNMLELKQGSTVFSTGTMLQSYCQKFPREFFGSAGSVNYKSDLAGDNEAKMRFIREHGFPAWNDLPLNEKSPTARHVVTGTIPSAAMKRSEYATLSLSEKSKLAGELGPTGIERILSRK
jgi:hypothetical protein